MKTVKVRNAFTGTKGTFEAFAQNGVVRVYDSIAGYWTTCHALTPSQVKRVKRDTRLDYYISTDSESMEIEDCKSLSDALAEFSCPSWVRSVEKFEKWLNKVGGFGYITENDIEICRVHS